MKVAKKLLLIATGYGLAVAGGVAAVAVNELRIPQDIKQASGGMVAFGDMIVLVLAAGFLSLAPTWFLLKLCVEKIPRILLAAEVLLAALGPASWLALKSVAAGANLRSLPHAFGEMAALSIAFGAIPRMVLGPVLLIIEGATFFLIRGRVARTLLAAAMLMDLIPLSMFTLHLAAATCR